MASFIRFNFNERKYNTKKSKRHGVNDPLQVPLLFQLPVGLALSCYTASAVLVGFIIACVIFLPQKAEKFSDTR